MIKDFMLGTTKSVIEFIDFVYSQSMAYSVCLTRGEALQSSSCWKSSLGAITIAI